ncbi:hypothetical protein Moror_2902 [Moniliophthora roreri MCA 2997]|nr:hypothetical protein Moror_2902 [Moniliophthora roreri MCA 2997]
MKVIVGKAQSENSSGDSKTKIFQGIRAVMWPEYHQINPKKTGECVKSQWEDLHSTYKEHATCLHQTGEGVEHEETTTDTNDVSLQFYILPEGPDHNTPVEAKNIWNQIVGNFKFFPRLHHILSTWANITPPTVTTGPQAAPIPSPAPPATPQPQGASLTSMPTPTPPSVGQTSSTSLSSTLQSGTLSQSSGLSNSQIASLAAVPRIPKKHGFDELLGDIYQKHIATAEQEAATDAKEKDHAHYHSEKATALRLFEAGIYTPRTTKHKICSIDRRLKKYESSPSPPSSPSRARSPYWDIEDSEGEQ